MQSQDTTCKPHRQTQWSQVRFRWVQGNINGDYRNNPLQFKINKRWIVFLHFFCVSWNISKKNEWLWRKIKVFLCELLKLGSLADCLPLVWENDCALHELIRSLQRFLQTRMSCNNNLYGKDMDAFLLHFGINANSWHSKRERDLIDLQDWIIRIYLFCFVSRMLSTISRPA